MGWQNNDLFAVKFRHALWTLLFTFLFTEPLTFFFNLFSYQALKKEDCSQEKAFSP